MIAKAKAESDAHKSALEAMASAVEAWDIGKEIEPEWVVTARKNYRHFEQKLIVLSNSGDYEQGELASREMKKIEERLKQAGYQL